MARGYEIAVVCVLVLQVAGIFALPAERTELVRPRSGLVDRHIVGGEYVAIEKVPYQLSLQTFWMHTCGAAIVSENYALTAGHCSMELDFITKFTTWLVAGSTTIFPFSFGGTKHSMTAMVAHPNYQYPSTDYDVAVIKVKSPFKFSKSIQSLPLPDESEERFLDYNVNATVSGWGVTAEGNFITPIWLKKGDIGLVDRETCKDAYHTYPVSTRMICAGGYGRGDSCQGDSGGPLAYKGRLIGLVSWGFGCNRLTYPGVYTNLFNDEIREFVKEHTGL